MAKKSELLDAVWTDTYVEETTLARNVSWLRNKLGEYADGERFIETVSKHGYRFTGEVTRPENNGNSLIVEEQIVQYFRGEEIITLDDAELMRRGEEEKEGKGEEENKIVALPNVSTLPRRPFTVSPFLLAAFALVALAGIGFIIYQNYIKTRAMNAIVPLRVMPFTGAAGNENNPAFSPDGNRLAYSWKRGEDLNSDIYTKLVGAGEPLQLTKTEANEQYPSFSPDGKYIAFIRGKYGEPGEVIIKPSLGGTERRVAHLFSGNFSISYSPDGQNIAVIDTENSAEGGQYAVYVINIETGRRRRVTAPAEFIGETTPRFSPDGKSLAFIRVFKEDLHGGNLAKQELFVVPVSGGEPRQITFDGLVINSLAWSADGEHIYFVPIRPPKQTIVRRVSVEGGEQEIVSTGGANITNVAVSPDGNKLVFAEDVRQWKIWRVPPGGQTGSKLLDSEFVEFFPIFSLDGSRIAFQSDRTGKSEIWTMDRNGKNLRQITDTPFPSTAPQFSPDGSQIVFNEKDGEKFYNNIVSFEGGIPRRISPEEVQEDLPIWSADDKYIYFSSNRSGIRTIWRTNADGSGETVQITKIDSHRATPTFDGKTVYFTKTGFPKELWRVPADGGTEEIVPEFNAAGFYNTWTMTKEGIYFLVAVSDQNFKLKLYDFADGQVKDARGNYKFPPNFDEIIISTDGTDFLCTILEKSSSLMLADLP